MRKTLTVLAQLIAAGVLQLQPQLAPLASRSPESESTCRSYPVVTLQLGAAGPTGPVAMAMGPDQPAGAEPTQV